MKKTYIEAMFEVVQFSAEDVLIASTENYQPEYSETPDVELPG